MKPPVCRQDESCSMTKQVSELLKEHQAEVLRDSIIELVERELPTDPKLAMAEVQRRRLEADQKDKYIRQLAPLGIRDRSEDKQASGSITLSWEGAEIVSG